LKSIDHVQVAVTVKPLLSPLLSHAYPFAAKGCGRSDSKTSRKTNFPVAIIYCNNNAF
jgi:hypothetical protein